MNNAKAQNVNGITKAIDECAYTKTIEDFAKEALKAPETVYLMRLMQVLVHAGFVSLRTQKAMISNFDKLLNEHH